MNQPSSKLGRGRQSMAIQNGFVRTRVRLGILEPCKPTRSVWLCWWWYQPAALPKARPFLPPIPFPFLFHMYDAHEVSHATLERCLGLGHRSCHHFVLLVA